MMTNNHKDMALGYIDSKIQHGVTDFAIGTRNGKLCFIHTMDLRAAIEKDAEKLLKIGNGIHLREFTYLEKGMTCRNMTAKALLDKAWLVVDIPDGASWEEVEKIAAAGINGRRTGGRVHHTADAGNGRLKIRVEVKANKGWMDGSHKAEDHEITEKGE